jgi:hypothetical protein
MVEMMYEFENPFVVDSSKFERRFDLQATPHEKAIYETLVWYQEHLVQQGVPVKNPVVTPREPFSAVQA